jgi:hypothetical protein
MEYQSGNLFIRDMDSLTVRHETGWIMKGHTHMFDHTTFICIGRYRCIQARPIINADGNPVLLPDGSQSLHVIVDVERGPGSFLFIDKNIWHSFECLEGPGMLMCLYSHRDPQTSEVVQQYNGWTEAYR